MNFAFPHALLIAAAVIPVSIILFFWKSRWTRRQLSGVVAPRLLEQLTSSIDWWKRRVKSLFFVFALILLLTAIARPQWGFQSTEVEREGIDFFVGLDLSRSMLAEDMGAQPRLEAAKEAIGSLLGRLGRGDRVGLIGFAGEPFVAAPLSEDYEAIRRTLGALKPETVALPGSNLAAAIRLAERSFASGNFDTKALVLVTDGEQLQGDAMITAQDTARNGMRIFTVGVGSAGGARIPERQADGSTGFTKNEFGTDVVSRLNKRVLQQVAASGRGKYADFGNQGSGLSIIYDQGLLPLGALKREKPTTDPKEYFQWPLALAIALFLSEMLVNERRKTARNPAK